jgi:hypothetical protein
MIEIEIMYSLQNVRTYRAAHKRYITYQGTKERAGIKYELTKSGGILWTICSLSNPCNYRGG